MRNEKGGRIRKERVKERRARKEKGERIRKERVKERRIEYSSEAG